MGEQQAAAADRANPHDQAQTCPNATTPHPVPDTSAALTRAARPSIAFNP